MARNLILCLDGTNNKYATTNTSVVRLYSMLDRASGSQECYYQPGIGTYAPPGTWGKFRHWWITRLDLAIAWLLEDHVCAAYRFLMRYYQDGDQIFIFGFSRGAYTARVLAAMLYKVGLLSKGNEELVPFAWEMFTNKCFQDQEPCVGFRRTFARVVNVHFLGLWDTVSSVGWMWNPSHYQYTFTNPSVHVIRHAVALDERRAYFVQNLWGHGTDVEQVWFPGVHSDVGGGYEDAKLSVLALEWMTRHAKDKGLVLDPAMEGELIPDVKSATFLSDHASGTAHESLRGWWRLGEILPKRIRVQTGPKAWHTSVIIPWGRCRTVPPDAHVHQSVMTRKQCISTYQPKNLPGNPTIVT